MAKKSNEETGREEYEEQYKNAKKIAKRAVAVSKGEIQQSLYEDLHTEEGQKKVFSIVKHRDRDATDLKHVKQIKEEQGRI